MLVVFANKMTLVDDGAGAGTTINTDPVLIGDNNQATGVTKVWSAINPSGIGLKWKMQVSNNGQDWVDQGPVLASATVAGPPTLQAPAAVSGVYARLEITYESAAATLGAATFDIQVNFTKV